MGQVDLTYAGELHHFGWNACSSCLCPYAPHPHVERGLALLRKTRFNLDAVWAVALIATGLLALVI